MAQNDFKHIRFHFSSEFYSIPILSKSIDHGICCNCFRYYKSTTLQASKRYILANHLGSGTLSVLANACFDCLDAKTRQCWLLLLFLPFHGHYRWHCYFQWSNLKASPCMLRLPVMPTGRKLKARRHSFWHQRLLMSIRCWSRRRVDERFRVDADRSCKTYRINSFRISIPLTLHTKSIQGFVFLFRGFFCLNVLNSQCIPSDPAHSFYFFVLRSCL